MLESLRAIVQEVGAIRELPRVLAVIVKRVRDAMQTGICSIYLQDPVDGDYVLMATEGLNPEAVGQVRLAKNQGLVGLVAAREEPINLEHAGTHPNFAYFPETGEEEFSSFMGAPIIHHRRVLGVLVVQQKQRRRFDEGEEAFLVTICAQLAAVIAHAEATGVLVTLTHDSGLAGPRPCEAIFRGVAAAPGVAIGTAVVIAPRADLDAVPRRVALDVDEEICLFRNAVEETRQDMRTLSSGLGSNLNPSERALFDVYVQMLDDMSLGGEVIQRIRSEGLAAQSALSEVVLEHVQTFRSMQDPYLRERATDVYDLGGRVLDYLQESQDEVIEFPEHAILVGRELSATNLVDVPYERLEGMVSLFGSRNSHMAILGRALGVPTIMGAVDLPLADVSDCEVIIDGRQGVVIVNPSDATRRYYASIRLEESLLAADLETLKDLPCITADDHRIALWVNTGLRIDTQLSLDRGAEGVGLYRTEMSFFLRDRFPTEEEQRKTYREQLELFAPRPVTMRTLDVGGDKALPYFPIEEDNPFLGWRGIRVTLDHPEIFLGQIRAMLKASEGLDNLRILLPMISNVQELEAAMNLIYRAFDELTEEEGFDLVMPPIGAMVEVPAAVYQVEELARRVDFLSVGTNDLTQYLLAVDRNNPRVADLYETTHPSVIMALKLIVEGARKENCPVSVCGEMAGDPVGAMLLVGLGYEVLSMNSSNLLRVKGALRQVTVTDLRRVLEKVLTLPDSDSVLRTFEDNFRDPELRRLLGIDD